MTRRVARRLFFEECHERRRGSRSVRGRGRARAVSGVPRGANDVKVTPHSASGATYFEVELSDAWVWDMYRPARFVASVRVVTYKDVNVEALPEKDG